ncbi:lytic murein transglycosylase [Psychrobacter sp. AOP7-D1-15]|uniref:lytic murein transglycosylase n=1 Tax=unclassified Psychrobacter TaxID=196806 RepID=UPI001865BDB9|nr:lytic murein transglycosylase [Psychrobacter sp. FME61]
MPSYSQLFTYTVLPLSVIFTTNISQAAPSDKPSLNQEEFESCLKNLAQSVAFSDVRSAFSQYRPLNADASVIKALNYQPEFSKEPWDYLASLVDEQRAIDGIKAREQYAEVLQRIESQYGVNRYDILGVWGVESDFGTTLGKKDVITSLATLSCFGRRQSYFRGEYVSALKILKQGDISLNDFKGSWAGAFGQTQFMPSTFLHLAQDFDGDGRKDLVNSQADALASTANFLKNSGYQYKQPWGYEVRLPPTINASSDRKKKQPIAYWRNLGVTLADGTSLPDSLSKAGLFLPSGKQGPAFLVGRNFDAFYAYNASENYALAIAHLSNRIEERNTNIDFVTPWPTDNPGLSRKESKEVQTALNQLGYDVGAVDGIIGDGTRSAIQDYQAANNLDPDGIAGKKIHQHLLANVDQLVATQTQNIDAQTLITDADEVLSSTGNDYSASKEVSSSEPSSPWSFKGKFIIAMIISLLLLSMLVLLIRKKR